MRNDWVTVVGLLAVAAWVSFGVLVSGCTAPELPPRVASVRLVAHAQGHESGIVGSCDLGPDGYDLTVYLPDVPLDRRALVQAWSALDTLADQCGGLMLQPVREWPSPGPAPGPSSEPTTVAPTSDAGDLHPPQ